jgi:putative transcriptional regulator
MKRPAGPMPTTSYEGRFLIAAPKLREGPFAKSVVYMCAHRADGAMGVIINHPADAIDFPRLLVQLEIVKKEEAIRLPRETEAIKVLRGGPVETGRGFVLHSNDYLSKDSTISIGEGLGMTATLDILRAIVKGEGPRRAVLALGYAGWAPGQLEGEIMDNGWLVGPADPTLIFDSDPSRKYDRALALIGVNQAFLSEEAGHA